jgi:hypothetical protein
MRIAILTIWTIGLIGALVPTAIIVKQASLVVWALVDIARLAALTRDAATGIARHVAVIPTLPDLADPAARLTEGAQASAGSVTRISAMLSGL